jgi:hypothetical protein
VICTTFLKLSLLRVQIVRSMLRRVLLTFDYFDITDDGWDRARAVLNNGRLTIGTN